MTHNFPSRPDSGRADATMVGWHALLHARFAHQPTPVVLFRDSVRSAASLWAGMRRWTGIFRAVGLGCGDRVVSVLPAGEALLQLTLACLWESVSLVLAIEGRDPDALLIRHDAQCMIGVREAGAHALVPADGGWPITPAAGWRLRAALHEDFAPPPGLAHAASATSLSYATCLRAAQQIRSSGLLRHARVLTLCDWQEPTGLWGGVIVPLLEAEELFVPSDTTDVGAVQRLLSTEPITHALVDTDTPAAVHAALNEHGVCTLTLPMAHR